MAEQAVKPRVSFIVPCYNYGRHLPMALDSLLSQSLQELEVIVIDDASHDETPSVFGKYAGNLRVRLIRHDRNRGHIATYNEGLDLARGEFVAILSADDYCLNPDAVRQQVALFDLHPSVGLVFTAHALVKDGHVSDYVVPSAQSYVRPGIDEYRHLIWGNYILHSGTLLRRTVQTELGPYDPRLTHTGDWDMWLRTAAKHDVGYLSEPMYGYRLHSTNMFSNAMPPWVETDQVVLTVERAFTAISQVGTSDLNERRHVIVDHAYLQTAWFDLANGRRRRTWQGVIYALRRRPRLLRTQEFWGFSLRLFFLTCLGPTNFRKLSKVLMRARASRARLPKASARAVVN
jgi:glycosyltransferase involved in cell wall biosynthesis